MNFDSMTSLQNIKLLILDFDDTLAIHKNTNYIENRKNDEDSYFLKAYESPQDFYETVEPCTTNNDISSLIAYCRRNNIPMFCVSGMRFTIHLPAKKAFINKHYGDDIELIASAGQERKKDVARILIKHFNIQPKQVLFVDDRYETLDMLKDIGVMGVHVSQLKDIPL